MRIVQFRLPPFAIAPFPPPSGRFVKQEQQGTLASEADISLWCLSPSTGDTCGIRGYHPLKIFEIVQAKQIKILQYEVYFSRP